MSTASERSEIRDELSSEALPREAALAFAPLHKRALGVALGVMGALVVAGVTAFHVIFLERDPTLLHLLGQYFAGYRPDVSGIFVGAFWGFVTCFVFGWFAAFLRNFILATLLFFARTREELAQTRDFLDHI
ncbi:MAG: hypothetical protein R3266_01780 [Gemmatimonadota bacterium]|nr:hypothetical protein [Gemmatimonadota bacterium]